MTCKPCVVCGEPSPRSRCDHHQPRHAPKPSAAARGYNNTWSRLSRRARRLQPWCLDCGSTEDLQADHSPKAWARKAAGKPIRLQDIIVRCGPCNRAAGPARQQTTQQAANPNSSTLTRGNAPSEASQDPCGKAKTELHTAGGACCE